jgi:hypothetical protein
MEYSEQMFRSRGNIKENINVLKEILYEDNKPVKHIGAIRSCIEADEASYLLKILNNNTKAKIYSLMCCFTFIPSVKCIEYLIAEGTPLDETFEYNPFKCTPQEYLDMYFPASNIMNGPRYNCLSRDAIYDAIERGKLVVKNREHTSMRPRDHIKSPLIKKVRKSILSILGTENKDT